MAIPQIAQIALPLIPGLIDAVIVVVERFRAEAATDEENQAALAQTVAELHEINQRVQDAPLPGDETPA